MKAGWETRKLGDVCEVFADGDWIESKDQAPDGIRLIQTGNVGLGTFKNRGEKARYISESTFNRLRCTEIFEGDCLISRLPDPVGRSCILPSTGERMITAVDCTIARFKLKKIIPKYFNYYSQSNEYLNAVDFETTGTTRKRISRTNLANTLIPIPPIAEQNRIVAILDKAFAAIATANANTEKNLLNARALFDSHLENIFAERGKNWDKETLQTLLDKGLIEGHLDGNHGSEYPRKEEFKKEGVPYISANCLDNDQVDLSRAKYLSPSRAAQIRKGVAKNGDVLFAHNATVGPVGMLRTGEPKIILGTSLTYYRCNRSHLIPEYLAHYMRSGGFRSQYEAVMRQSTRNQVPITKQREFYHVIPPLPDQRAIVRELDQLLTASQHLASGYQRRLSGMEQLGKSLLDRAFAGAL